MGKIMIRPTLQWQTPVALVAIASLTTTAIVPFTWLTPATAAPVAIAPTPIAQLFPSSRPQSVTLPAGTRIPARYEAADRILVAPTETLPLTITIPNNIRTSTGTLLIPSGSQVLGTVRPVNGGSQFVAETLVLPNGTRIPLAARSEVIATRQEVQPGVNGDALIKGSAIGAGAATILSGVLGNRRITLGRVLLGAGAGALGGLLLGKKKAEVIVIDAKADLSLTLDSRLTLPPAF